MEQKLIGVFGWGLRSNNYVLRKKKGKKNGQLCVDGL
jgi:hypothetical protein